MARVDPQASRRPLGERLVSAGWAAIGLAILVSFALSDEPFNFSYFLALLSLLTLCAGLACWPRLFLSPIRYRSFADSMPRPTLIAMSTFVGLTVLRAMVELVA
ncbi:hypothetical protein [Pseudomonas boanensis]|uniref:hypothetical protein n=1 Tax=Metapseudomonas boanensis TaxID=2822138 RepID=UPI0035D4725A